MQNQIREKPHRLPRELYKGHRWIAFTCCIENRHACFRDANAFKTIEALLQKILTVHNIDAHVYLFMPDHCHLLLEGKDDGADMYACMVSFKQQSGFWLSQHTQTRWQKNFYDHILRKEEDIEKHVRYILQNPERKRLAQDWKEYPYKGSTVYDFNTW